jgi:glycosyltransferase involved in cell wall biosynthesis
VSVPAPAPLRLSVIVPSWNDRDNLGRLIPALARLNEFHEVIVVDASPDPVAEEIVRAGGGIHCRTEIPNRGAQMNLGGERATDDVLIVRA